MTVVILNKHLLTRITLNTFGRKIFLQPFIYSNSYTRLYSTKTKTIKKKDELVKKKEQNIVNFGDSDVIKCTKDQWLYKPTAREIKLFLDSKPIPTRPLDLENSVVVKLVDLAKEVTSPVKSSVYFSEYGIRKGETLKLVMMWLLFTSVCMYLGFWQLKRKKWKEQVIVSRQKALQAPKIVINSLSDIIENSKNDLDVDGLFYRVVEAHGVLDTKQQFLVGPRKSLVHEHGKEFGFNVLYPLRFKDGSSILVNMGWLNSDELFDNNIGSEWVTVRGILVSGEITENLIPSIKYKTLVLIEKLVHSITGSKLGLTKSINRPSHLVCEDSRKVYKYMDPQSIGQELFSKCPDITQKYILSVYDSYFDEDKPSLDVEHESNNDSFLKRLLNNTILNSSDSSSTNKYRTGPYRFKFQRKQKSDYLLFYADPSTHFNYALQWFLIGFSITALSVYKFFRINKVLKNLILKNLTP
ncbi:uncharacterized protein TA08925 [Theileria annulata]|uniref:SURF1-like protein n=1 Tax=Theileria annulata TaxID=5874 RepID=Q4U9D9_THEAN|nr:uncharacterized protein TA08925 [Theileria annulata]CAI76564.1 hypothetical protein, conserved [Theileria annulata]|eukprot:XP_953189.1 hypothetical protein, conserved [Theileria annulata]